MTALANIAAARTQRIAIDRLHPSLLNTRHIDRSSADIQDLADSLRTLGQAVPILARPQGDNWEILDGHRRFNAALLANLPDLEVKVITCDDRTALKIILVANLQREGLGVLEEAQAVRLLIDAGYTPDEVAAELGKTPRWVASRAQVTALTASWREGLAAGTHPWATVGYLEQIARLPDEVQDEMAKDYADEWKKPGSLETFASQIANRYLHSMKAAPWKLDDASMLIGVGACAACPKRSSCQQLLWDDQADATDRCLDAVCWSRKLDVHTASAAKRLAEKHDKVLILTTAGQGTQPAPSNLPEQAISVKRHQTEACKKTDEGSMPAIDADTGKTTYVRAAPWADKETKKALGITDANPAKAKEPGSIKPIQTADGKREGKRLQLRLQMIHDALTDADQPPSLEELLQIFIAFHLLNFNPLTDNGWAEAMTQRSTFDLIGILWEHLTTTIQTKISGTNASAVLRNGGRIDLAAIEQLERLATLDPAEQAAKALEEVPESKRKGKGKDAAPLTTEAE